MATKRRLRGVGRHVGAVASAADAANHSVTVPGYFNAEGFAAFQGSTLRSSDVVFVSFPKCGTSWLHQILFCLLRMDERGEFGAPLHELLGSDGQIYPDSVPVSADAWGRGGGGRGRGGRGGGRGRGGRGRGRGGMQGASIEALMGQPEPRLFTCADPSDPQHHQHHQYPTPTAPAQPAQTLH